MHNKTNKQRYFDRNYFGLCAALFIAIFLFDYVCPIEAIIGIPCPGCNLFTAMYWLFVEVDLTSALYFHPVFPWMLLYIVVIGGLFVKKGSKFTKSFLFKVSSAIFLTLFIGIYVYRMIFIFPDPPMNFNQDALLMRILNLF